MKASLAPSIAAAVKASSLPESFKRLAVPRIESSDDPKATAIALIVNFQDRANITDEEFLAASALTEEIHRMTG